MTNKITFIYGNNDVRCIARTLLEMANDVFRVGATTEIENIKCVSHFFLYNII